MDSKPSTKSVLAVAWIAILSISLFKIILQEVLHYPVSEALQLGVEAAIIAVGLALSFVWKELRALRAFFGLLAALVAAQWLVYTQIDSLPIFKNLLSHPSFNVYMLVEQSLNLMVTALMITFLLLLGKKPREFFLAKGDLNAPAEAVKWLDIPTGQPWTVLGRNFAFFISLGTLAFLVIAGRPPLDIVFRALPFLPAVLLCAALNAFNEEMTYKASFLSVLEGVVGKKQALLLMAAFFGIFHFYGIPYGVIGVALAAFLGWLLGKSMLETRGLFWAWFIHFLQDVLIFAFLAIGSIIPGGG